MTGEEAQAVAERMNREHPDRRTHRWVARRAGEDWEVVKVRLPGLGRPPLQATTEAAERPPQADDPRPAHMRDAPGAWG